MLDAEVTGFCKTLRNPGGTVPNDPAAIAGGGPAVIRNPGTNVTPRAEAMLKLACYYVRHFARVARPVTPADITRVRVYGIEQLKRTEDNHKDPTEKPTIDDTDWPKTMEALDSYFLSFLGDTGIPLSYVIRRERADPAVPVDPPDGYASVSDEMIHRAPHQDENGMDLPSYLADRVKVWDLLAALCRDHNCYSYIKPAQRSRNGRDAYWRLNDHYLGANNLNNMASQAEGTLMSARYQGEKKRWNFESYVRTHVDQHAILDRLKEHGYSGIDEQSKVRHLLAGIRTGSLDTIKANILGNPAYQCDFAKCVTLYKDFIHQMTPAPADSNVSKMGTEAASGDSEHEPGAKIVDKFYSRKAYKTCQDEVRRAQSWI